METTWDGAPIAADDPRYVVVVVWRRGREGREFLLLHRQHHGPDYAGDWAWTSPAGARQPGEDPLYAARRELFEESGLQLPVHEVEREPGEIALFHAEAGAEADVRLDAEHDAFTWAGLDEAVRRCLPSMVGDSFRLVDTLLEASEIP